MFHVWIVCFTCKCSYMNEWCLCSCKCKCNYASLTPMVLQRSCTGRCLAPCTWPELTVAPPWLRPNLRAPLESMEAAVVLTWPCHHRRRWVHHRAPALSHHARRWDSSGEPLSQPRAPVKAGCRVGHDGEDATTDKLAVGELRPVSAVLCSCLTDTWACWPTGPSCPLGFWIFLYLFF